MTNLLKLCYCLQLNSAGQEQQTDEMQLSEGYELLTPTLRNYEGEGLIDAGKDAVEMTDYVVQAG